MTSLTEGTLQVAERCRPEAEASVPQVNQVQRGAVAQRTRLHLVKMLPWPMLQEGGQPDRADGFMSAGGTGGQPTW